MPTTHSDEYLPGVIVYVSKFPFQEGVETKPRFALVIARRGADVTVRGIYTKHHPGYAAIAATPDTRLHHDSYLSTRRVTLRIHQIDRFVGDTAIDYDPFDDFIDLVA